MLRKITIALVGLVVIIAVGGGVWYVLKYLPKPKEQVISTIPQGWKTYVSELGFSIKHPAHWTVKEWPIQPRLVGRPINLFDNRGNNLEFSFSTYVNKYKRGFVGREEKAEFAIRKHVEQLNLFKEIEGNVHISNRGKNVYVYYGKSNFNPRAKYIVAMIYIRKIFDYLIIKEEVYANENFNEKLKVFIEALNWITSN